MKKYHELNDNQKKKLIEFMNIPDKVKIVKKLKPFTKLKSNLKLIIMMIIRLFKNLIIILYILKMEIQSVLSKNGYKIKKNH